MIFLVAEDMAKWEKVSSSNFLHLNVWERQHIEEWVRSSPEVLGEDLLIVYGGPICQDTFGLSFKKLFASFPDVICSPK